MAEKKSHDPVIVARRDVPEEREIVNPEDIYMAVGLAKSQVRVLEELGKVIIVSQAIRTVTFLAVFGVVSVSIGAFFGPIAAGAFVAIIVGAIKAIEKMSTAMALKSAPTKEQVSQKQ
jgi:hypothetical protein